MNTKSAWPCHTVLLGKPLQTLRRHTDWSGCKFRRLNDMADWFEAGVPRQCVGPISLILRPRIDTSLCDKKRLSKLSPLRQELGPRDATGVYEAIELPGLHSPLFPPLLSPCTQHVQSTIKFCIIFQRCNPSTSSTFLSLLSTMLPS